MFTIVQWDDALDLLVQFLIAVAVFAVIMVVVRRVEKKSRPTSGKAQEPFDDSGMP